MKQKLDMHNLVMHMMAKYGESQKELGYQLGFQDGGRTKFEQEQTKIDSLKRQLEVARDVIRKHDQGAA